MGRPLGASRQAQAPPSGRGPFDNLLPPGAWLGLLGLLAAMGFAAVRLSRNSWSESFAARRLALLPLASLLLTVALWASCGGGGGSGVIHVPGTPAGTYTLTIAATSGNLSHSTAVTFAVQ